jgi:hypothetical protein
MALLSFFRDKFSDNILSKTIRLGDSLFVIGYWVIGNL